MKRFSLLALLAVIIVALAFAGCGGGGGGGTDMGGGGNGGGDDIEDPPGTGDLPGGDPGAGDTGTISFVIGKVVNAETRAGIPNVTVIVTNKPELVTTYTTKTKADGSFQVALQDDVSILSLFDLTGTPTIALVSSTAGTLYPSTQPVYYNDMWQSQGNIEFDLAALIAEGDFGEIGLKSTSASGNDDLDGPPSAGGGDGPP